jgi:hypothetical protein
MRAEQFRGVARKRGFSSRIGHLLIKLQQQRGREPFVEEGQPDYRGSAKRDAI